MNEYPYEVKPIAPELAEGAEIDVPIGINIIDKIKPTKIAELLAYLIDVQSKLKLGMQIDSEKYHGYTTIWEWWAELDRCFNVTKKAKTDRNYQDTGENRNVSPKFNYTISADMLTMQKIFNNLPKKFSAVSNNSAQIEHLALGESIVKDSILKANVIGNFKIPSYELSNHGCTIIADPLVVKEVEISAFNDYLLDKWGQSQSEGGQMLKDPRGPSWKKQLVRKVYTEFRPVNKDRLLINPTIHSIKDQPVIVEGIIKNLSDLREMEETGDISNLDDLLETGADCEQFWTGASTHDQKTGSNYPEECQTKTINKILFWYKDLTKKDGEYRRYECLLGSDKTILQVKEYIYDNWRYVSGVRGINPEYPGWGLGKGQIIYPAYINFNRKQNQIMDIGELESKGGGICDQKIQRFLGAAEAGVWQGVPNYNPDKLLAKGWRELLGINSNNMMKDLQILGDQVSEAVPTILTGHITGTSAERSAAGMNLLGNNALTTLETEFHDIEGQVFGDYARDCYKNFVLFLQETVRSTEDLMGIMVETFGQEVMTYQGEVTKEHPDGVYMTSMFVTVFPEVDFEFRGALDAIKKIEDTQVIKETFGLLAQLSAACPEQIASVLAKTDLTMMLKEYMQAVGAGDIDKYFPAYNPSAELMQLKQQLASVVQDGVLSKEILARLMGDLQSAAIDTTFGNQELINKIKDIAKGISNQQTSKNQ